MLTTNARENVVVAEGHVDVRASTATMTTMPTTMILITLSAKSSALHSGTRLLSTLISLLAPSTPMSTLLALAFSLPLPHSTLYSFFCCCWGALLRSKIFHNHDYIFPLLVAVL